MPGGCHDKACFPGISGMVKLDIAGKIALSGTAFLYFCTAGLNPWTSDRFNPLKCKKDFLRANYP